MSVARPASWLCMDGRLQWLSRLKVETLGRSIVPATQPYERIVAVRNLSASKASEAQSGKAARQQNHKAGKDESEADVAPVAGLAHCLVCQH